MRLWPCHNMHRTLLEAVLHCDCMQSQKAPPLGLCQLTGRASDRRKSAASAPAAAFHRAPATRKAPQAMATSPHAAAATSGS